MTRKLSVAILMFGLTAGFVSSCEGGEEKSKKESKKQDKIEVNLSDDDMELLKEAKKYFKVLPKNAATSERPLDSARVALGKMLFFDTRLSKSNTISCNSCHNLASYGVDNNPTSIGHGWQAGPRNSPTVLNAALHIAQFWDGRAKDVEEQAEGPILNSIEMGSSSEEFVVARLRSIPEYVTFFENAYPDAEEPLTYKNIAIAIGAFERTLITRDPFDRFMQGDGEALTSAQKKGLKTFMDVGCTTCHTGSNLGGELFMKFGLIKGPYWEYTRSVVRDEGKYEDTKVESDKYVFKVPSLRNIMRTAPYFHDGSIWDIKEAVSIMGITQLGKELTDEQVDEITDFLEALTGEIPEDARKLPVLPNSGRETSRPEFD